ncbi:hypothetical protein BDW74DRAFT_184071 [Aspergillus multicolor]|uniref:uncharacterized protein n=1 Tax=Aspergillus multicolor TaxID=41759 RepID=UPI003CCDC93A
MAHSSRLAAQPAAEAADVLETAGIDYVSFGWLTVALLAHDCNFAEVEFIVRDRDLIAAREPLADAGFHLCTDQVCKELHDIRHPSPDLNSPAELFRTHRPNKHHLPPATHIHLDFHYEGCDVLKLYKKSSLLRWIPVLEDDPRNNDPALVWLANDPRLPAAARQGWSWTHLGPVRILNPASFCEVLIMLLCRDYGSIQGREFVWRGMWEELVKSCIHARLNRPLRPDFKELWDAAEDFFLRHVRSQAPLPKLCDLRRRLIASGEILADEIPQIDELRLHS